MTSNRKNPNQRPVQKRDDVWSFIIAALLTLAFVILSTTAVCITYINWQNYTALESQRHQQALDYLHWQMLDQASEAADSGYYRDCLQIVLDVPPTSIFYSRSQALQKQCYQPLAEEWMAKGKGLAASGHLKDAIAQVNQIQQGSLYPQAKDSITAWSQQIIDIAEQHYGAPTDRFDEALNVVSQIPEYSSLYQTSQKLYQRWQQEKRDNQGFYEEAEAAINANNLDQAVQFAQQISLHSAWKDRRDRLLQSAENAQQQLDQTSQEVDRLAAQGKLNLAAQKAQQLPNREPWASKKLAIAEEIEAAKHQADWRPVAVGILIALLVVSLFKRKK